MKKGHGRSVISCRNASLLGYENFDSTGNHVDCNRQSSERLTIHVEQEAIGHVFVEKVDFDVVASIVLYIERMNVGAGIHARIDGKKTKPRGAAQVHDVEKTVIGTGHGRGLHAAPEEPSITYRDEPCFDGFFTRRVFAANRDFQPSDGASGEAFD